MKIWDVEVWVVTVTPKKDEAEFWECWSTETVVADTLDIAVQKGVVAVNDSYDFFKCEARKAELIREVDVE